MLLAAPGVDRVIHLRTVHLGPDELLVTGKIAVSGQAVGADIATTIDDAESRVRDVLPSAQIIYLEPDIYRPESTARQTATPSARPTPHADADGRHARPVITMATPLMAT